MNIGREVLFFASNNDTQLKTFVPVIRSLREEYSVQSMLVSGCELKGIPTDLNLLTSLGVPHEVLESKVRSHRLVQLLRSATTARYRIGALLDKHRPSAVVLGHDHALPNNYVVKEARRRRISSLLLQDGVMRDGLSNLTAGERLVKSLAGIPLRYGQGQCTRVAAWGPRARKYFLAAGVSPDRIDAVGCPRFDEVLRNGWSSRSSLSSLLPPASHRIIYLAGAEAKFGLLSTAEYNAILLAMLRAPRQLQGVCPDTHLVIKLHRDDDLAATRDLVRASGEGSTCTVLQSEVDLYDLLSACDVAVTFCSTAGLEALLLNKPLIVLNPTNRPDLIDYAAGGAALGVRTAHELNAALIRLLSNSQLLGHQCRNKNEYLAAQLGPLDGHATARVAQLVVTLCHSEIGRGLSDPIAGFHRRGQHFHVST